MRTLLGAQLVFCIYVFYDLSNSGVAWFLCQIFMRRRMVVGGMTKQSHYEMGPAGVADHAIKTSWLHESLWR